MLLLEELVLKVLQIVDAVVAVVILAVFLLFPSPLGILASVLTAFVFCEVY